MAKTPLRAGAPSSCRCSRPGCEHVWRERERGSEGQRERARAPVSVMEARSYRGTSVVSVMEARSYRGTSVVSVMEARSYRGTGYPTVREHTEW